MAQVKSIWAALGVTAPTLPERKAAKSNPVPSVRRVLAMLEPDAEGIVIALVQHSESANEDGHTVPAHERVTFLTAKTADRIPGDTRILTYPPDRRFWPFSITEDRLAKASNAWPELQKRKAANAKK